MSGSGVSRKEDSMAKKKKSKKSSKRRSSKPWSPTRVPKRMTRLSAKEKATIKSMTKAGATMRQIAKKIGRVPSTVWRWQQER